MINHFATLLVNLDLAKADLLSEDYVLGTGEDEILFTDDDLGIKLSEIYANYIPAQKYSKFICRDYVRLDLPQSLQNFYNLIFPQEASDYYKEFLLFNYLNLVESSGMLSAIQKYDTRISYSLNDNRDYFTLGRISNTAASDTNYSLSVSGKLLSSNAINSALQGFVIYQIGNSSDLLLFSPTQFRYYKAGKNPSRMADNMQTNLLLEADGKNSKPIKLGDTGLTFRLRGPFNDLSVGFTQTSSKVWSFSAEAQLKFDFLEIVGNIKNHPSALEDMLTYNRDLCDVSYENLWNMHFNSVYGFAGLLLAYVQRVNLLWERQAT
jgi:hypothetical protein